MALLAFAMAMAVLKMVILALLIAGLIFRTKETIGLLLIGGVFALFRVHLLLGLGCVALIIVGVMVGNSARNKEAALRLPDDASP